MSIKLLSIGSDRNLFTDDSAVVGRIKEYGSLVDELHVIVFAKRNLGLHQKKLANNIWLYPTNSLSRLQYVHDAIRIAETLRFNLVTTQDPFESGLSGLRIKRRTRVPLEVQLHTDLYARNFNGFLNLVRKIIAKQVLRGADGVRVVTESLKAKINNPNTYVLPISIDRKRIEGEPKFDLHEKYGFKRVVLAVSRLSPEKNIDMAIEAVEGLPDTGLIIVGDGPERKRIRESEKVKFVGWQEDLASYYKTADVFIQTSKYEGYGLSLVEAGLCGLPVVSTPVGIAQDLKNVKIAETTDQFREAIMSLSKKTGEDLKRELEVRVLTKEAFLNKLKENWSKLC